MMHDARHAQRGMTLVESMVSIGLLITVVLGVFGGITRIFAVNYTDMLLANLQMNLSIAMDSAGRQLQSGRVQAVAADGSSLQFQVPVDPDGDGSVITAGGTVDWGYTLRGTGDTAGAFATVRFTTTGVLDESVINADLNGDGDQIDQFDRGRLERVTFTGVVEELTGAWLLQPTGNWGGEVLAGEGNAPLFNLVTDGSRNTLATDLHLVIPIWPNRWIVRRHQFIFDLPNDAS